MQNRPQIDPRLAHVARLLPHQVNRVRLSKTQLSVLNQVKKREEVTALVVAKRTGHSISWSSSLLKSLFVRGYMDRRSQSKHLGGIEYFYFRKE